MTCNPTSGATWNALSRVISDDEYNLHCLKTPTDVSHLNALSPTSAGWYPSDGRIVNSVLNDMCLDDTNWSTQPGTQLQVWQCASGQQANEQWAATAYRSRTTVTNRHPFPLRALVLRDGVPVSEDDKRVSVVLRRPAGLAELEQGKELNVSAEDGACKDEKRIVRWGKVVDGKGGRKEGLLEGVFEVGAGEEVTIETEWDVKAPVSLRWIESA